MNFAKHIFRFSSCLFFCFCAAGLLWQLVTIIDEYFRYKVITSTSIFIPDIIEPTAMTIYCRSLHLLNFTGLKQDLNISISLDTELSIAKQIVNNLTVKQLFDYTPSNNSIVDRMTYKPKDQSLPAVVPSGNLNILKFFGIITFVTK